MNELLTYDNPLEEMVNDSSFSLEHKFPGNNTDEPIFITLRTSQKEISNFSRKLDELNSFQIKKDNYYVQAIKNLMKKNNFLELTVDLAEKNISEEEYYNKIEKNPEKYIIDINLLKDPNDLFVINEIIKKLGIELSLDEVSEIFSLDPNDIENKVSEIK